MKDKKKIFKENYSKMVNVCSNNMSNICNSDVNDQIKLKKDKFCI